MDILPEGALRTVSSKGICPFCCIRPLGERSNSRTCGNLHCVDSRKKKYQNAYYHKNKIKKRAAVYAWRKANPEKIREIARKCYRKNPTKRLEYNKERQRRIRRLAKEAENSLT